MTQKTPMQDYTHIADSYDEDRFQGIRGEFNYAIDREIVSEYAEIAAPNKCLMPQGRDASWIIWVICLLRSLDAMPHKACWIGRRGMSSMVSTPFAGRRF